MMEEGVKIDMRKGIEVELHDLQTFILSTLEGIRQVSGLPLVYFSRAIDVNGRGVKWNRMDLLEKFLERMRGDYV